ncbi:uncharacterized protein BDZ99DRAFT_164749 [Mytilinidion resinicola]|uniref:RING-type domain-containing protein n=1 Tax=Mytilinidion resinicola TaxID=574789 RepID=A0A6A6Y5S9_9PEZI|nr:uncharacterized protein BDZ99DRAFT_164749 [Mytilinidion resinicola]KAF2803883.1 hypothetical protein BDZ99DRAFT_164749 [Mytilinidion resinicola]
MKAQTVENDRLRKLEAEQRMGNDDGKDGKASTARPVLLPRQDRFVGTFALASSMLGTPPRRLRLVNRESNSSRSEDMDWVPFRPTTSPIVIVSKSRAASSNPAQSRQAAQASDTDHDMADAASSPANAGAVAAASSIIRPAINDSAPSPQAVQAPDMDLDMADAATSPPSDEDTISVSSATFLATSLEPAVVVPAQPKERSPDASASTIDIGQRLQALEERFNMSSTSLDARLHVVESHHGLASKFMAAVEEDLEDAAKGSERFQAYRYQCEIDGLKKKEMNLQKGKTNIEEELVAVKAQLELTNFDFAQFEDIKNHEVAVLQEKQGKLETELAIAKEEIESMKRERETAAQSSKKKIQSQLDTYRALEKRLDKERGTHKSELQTKDNMLAALKESEGKLKGEIDEIKMAHEDHIQQLQASKDFELKEAAKREEEAIARDRRIGEAEVEQLKEMARRNRREWLGTKKDFENQAQELEQSGKNKDDEIARLTSELRNVQQRLDMTSNAVPTDSIPELERPRKRVRWEMNDEELDEVVAGQAGQEEDKCVKCHGTPVEPYLTSYSHLYCLSCLEERECLSCGGQISYSVPRAMT